MRREKCFAWISDVEQAQALLGGAGEFQLACAQRTPGTLGSHLSRCGERPRCQSPSLGLLELEAKLFI